MWVEGLGLGLRVWGLGLGVQGLRLVRAYKALGLGPIGSRRMNIF